MADYTACFMCCLPQTICSRADPEANGEMDPARQGKHIAGCRFADMVMPLCYGAFFSPGPRAFLNKHSLGRFRDEADYMLRADHVWRLTLHQGSTTCSAAAGRIDIGLHICVFICRVLARLLGYLFDLVKCVIILVVIPIKSEQAFQIGIFQQFAIFFVTFLRPTNSLAFLNDY